VLPVVTVVATIGTKDEKFEVGAKVPPADLVEQARALKTVDVLPVQPKEIFKVVASPRAKKKARELNVDLSQVMPTGSGGARITEKDVIAYFDQSPKMTPVAQRIAREAQMDLRGQTGSGPKGRITKADLESILQAAPVGVAASTSVTAQSLPTDEVSERLL